jgi:hypothetical protein
MAQTGSATTAQLASRMETGAERLAELERKIAWLTWVLRRHSRSEYHAILDRIARPSDAEPLPAPVGMAGSYTEPSQADIDGAPNPN